LPPRTAQWTGNMASRCISANGVRRLTFPCDDDEIKRQPMRMVVRKEDGMHSHHACYKMHAFITYSYTEAALTES
jgi:hypothetical protein